MRLSQGLAAFAVITLVSCGGASPAADTEGGTSSAGVETAKILVAERIDAIDAAVSDWRAASSLAAARASAETAANLVVGPNGPGYGDRDGDGVVGGDTSTGLLPGLDATPDGLVSMNDQVLNTNTNVKSPKPYDHAMLKYNFPTYDHQLV